MNFDQIHTQGRVLPDRIQSTKKSKLRNCCAKICSFIKKIFYTLFCCFLCFRRKNYPTQHDKDLFRRIEARKAYREKKLKEAEKIDLTPRTELREVKGLNLDLYKLTRSEDPDSQALKDFAVSTIGALLLDSPYKDDIEKSLKSGMGHIRELSTPKTLQDKGTIFAPLLTLIRPFFDQKLEDLFSLVGTNFEKVEAVKKAFDIMILALFDTNEEHLKRELKLRKNDKIEPSKIAEIICEHILFKKLDDVDFRVKHKITPDQYTEFMKHKKLIHEVITRFNFGIKYLEQFNIKEIIYIIYDMFIFSESFMKKLSQDKEGKNLRKNLSQTVEHLNNDLIGIEREIIEKNLNKIVSHLCDRIALIFGQSVKKDDGIVYPEHQQKVNALLSDKGLKQSLNALVFAEDKKNKFLERNKETSAKENLDEAAEEEFISEFVLHPGCHPTIQKRVQASQGLLKDEVLELKNLSIKTMTEELCTYLFPPLDLGGKQQEPWLRVLWDSLEKPTLQKYLNEFERIIDEFIKSLSFKSSPLNFKHHVKGLIQFIAVQYISQKIEEFIKTTVMNKIFDLISNQAMFFKLIFDSLFQARIGEILEKESSKDTLIDEFSRLCFEANSDSKAKIRERIAVQLQVSLIGHKNSKLKIEDLKNEGIIDFKDASGQMKKGRFNELAIYVIMNLEKFIDDKIKDVKPENRYETLKHAIKDYFKQPLGENRKKLKSSINKNLADMVNIVVFEMGKLETPLSGVGIWLFQNSILEMLSNIIVPLRDSPYYLANVLRESLNEKTKLNGNALHAYFNQKQDEVTVERENAQFKNFSKLLYDTLSAKSSAIGFFFNSDKTIDQIDKALHRIFKTQHAVADLNFVARGVLTYNHELDIIDKHSLVARTI